MHKQKRDHMQVLQTLCFAGLITRQAMKSIRGQILSMRTVGEREAYIKKIIARIGREEIYGKP